LNAYAHALAGLQALSRFGVRLGLERMERLVTDLDIPLQRIPVVHLAGTNGKGSTAAMLASCLGAAGYRVGLYTSPHLSRFTERIRVAGEEIPQDAVARLTRRVCHCGGEVTFFEAVTAMALAHFVEQEVDLAVMETGLGGRLDATNVVRPVACVITRIGLDHTEVLGSSQAAVAAEKAGIIKAGAPVFSARPATAGVGAVLAARCQEEGCSLHLLGQDFHLRGGTYQDAQWRLDGVRPGLRGEHQQENAALCLAALSGLRQRGYPIRDRHALRGIAGVDWPGRLERIQQGGEMLLDGAHNAGAFAALARVLGKGQRYSLILGMLDSPKDVREMVSPLLPHVSRVIVTRPQSPRDRDPQQIAGSLAGLIPHIQVARDFPAALSLARQHPEPGLVTGSLYLVGAARALLLGEPTDPLPLGDPPTS